MKKKHYIKYILVTMLSVTLIAVIAGIIIFNLELNKIKTVKLNTSDAGLGIATTSPVATENKITNILLFGDDRRTTSENGRSDSMMILSLNESEKKVKLVSIMRDMYVTVEGHGQTKLTHAYSYGGAQLAIKTINQNLQLDIRNYVKVDFAGLEKIVDLLGGVEINIKPAEIAGNTEDLNYYIKELSKLENVTPQYITTAGTHNLNGIQAVAYSRIRYVGNNDFERTERQRTVLTKLLEKIKAKGASAFPSVMTAILPYIETSLDKSEILSLAMKSMSLGITNIEQQRVPYDGHYFKVDSSTYYMGWDKDYTLTELHKFLYGTSN